MEIDGIDGEMKTAVLLGKINNISDRQFKTGNNLLTFELADKTNGIDCKIFFKDKDEFEHVNASLANGLIIEVAGSIRFDSFNNDFVMMPNSIYKSEMKKRMDTAKEKRVELHAHTHMSNMDAVVSAKDLICTAARWGWPAIAITDHGVVQAFPEAAKTIADKNLNIKIIYGLEGYLIYDEQQKRANHIILLAKNAIGLRNIYRLVSLSHFLTLI